MGNRYSPNTVLHWYWSEGISKFSIVAGVYKTGKGVTKYVLRDRKGNFTIDHFDTTYEAAEFAYELTFGLLTAPETSYQIGQMLRRHEKEITIKMGQPDITGRQREVLGLMKDMIHDAITKGPFSHGK